MPVKRLAYLRYRKLTRCALDQAYAEPFFKLRDTTAQFRFGLMTCPPRSSETAVLHYFHKPREIIEILHKNPVVPDMEQ